MPKTPIALILAAGLSRRMGRDHKLLLRQKGMTIIERTTCAFIQAGFEDITVITGYGHEQIESCLAKMPVHFIYNADYREGMATSIRAGMHSVTGDFSICPGDLPWLQSTTVRTLKCAWQARDLTRHRVLIPVFEQQFGHPVFFAQDLAPSLHALRGDVGARNLLRALVDSDHALLLEVEDPGILRDVDTPQDL
ncbi:MAG: nucleotidyltransferase family protein [Pseudomonadota bacterium]